MNLNRFLSPSVVPVLFMLVATSASAGTSLHQARYGYSVVLPDGWEQIPIEVINAQTRAITTMATSPLGQHYEDGFQQSAQGKWFHCPFVLVQVKETGRVPEAQFTRMKSLSANVKKDMDIASEKLAKIVSGMSLGDTYYDPSNKCLWVRMSMNVGSVGEVRAVTCSFLTEKGWVSFFCYENAAEFDRQLATFLELLRSVQFTEALRYKPHYGDHFGFDFSRLGRSVVVGGLSGGLIWLAIRLMKKQQAKKPPVEPPPLS